MMSCGAIACLLVAFCYWINRIKAEGVTLIPPENLVQNIMLFGRTSDPTKHDGQVKLKFSTRLGVLSGVPIPTLWPVLPIAFGQNKQLIPTTPAPQNTEDYASPGYSYGSPGDSSFLSQVVRPSQPFSSFVGSQQMPAVYGTGQQNNMIGQPENYLNQYNTFAQNNFLQNGQMDFSQQNPQQPQINNIPIGPSFGIAPNAQPNPLTPQDIFLSAYQGPQQQLPNPQVPSGMVNAFGNFMTDATGQQPQQLGLNQQQAAPFNSPSQAAPFNSPSQVYGYGSQPAFANQIQSGIGNQFQPSGGYLLGQGLEASSFGNALEDRYPGCHK